MTVSLSKILSDEKAFQKLSEDSSNGSLQELQLKMLRVQQGLWHQKKRAVIVFEGFDAAGKGGAIRRLIEGLDPRSVRVYPIGPPTPEEQGKHWLYRFWRDLPAPGTMSIFDRSWYGRVLVERVEELTTPENWKRAYKEINQFEKTLQDDGIEVIKIFLAITKDEQLSRFEERLNNPYKHWKLTRDDLRGREKWDCYVEAVDEMLINTSKRSSPWRVIPANHKPTVRREVLNVVTTELRDSELWMNNQASHLKRKSLADALKELENGSSS